jgi:hypothetical protein
VSKSALFSGLSRVVIKKFQQWPPLGLCWRKEMASEFDELIQQLKLVQTAPDPLRKALPASTGPAPRSFDMKALNKNLDVMAKALGLPKAVQSRRLMPSRKETVLKSLFSIHAGIQKAAAAGALTRVQQVELEAGLSTQIKNALSHFRTGGK